MIKSKGLVLLFIISAIIVVVGGALTFRSISAAQTEFAKDGYILSSSNEGNIDDDVNQNYYFNGGEKYKIKYPGKVVFKDNSGNKVAVEKESYVHYSEGSIGALTAGVILDLNSLDKKDRCYYSITPQSILAKSGEKYEVENLGEDKVFSNFIWKTSENSYLVASKNVKLYDGKNAGKEFPAYAEINYVDNGVVYIVSQEGTYQTISTDAYLKFDNGVKLQLTSKDVMDGDEAVINLSEMLIDSDDNVEIKPPEANQDEAEKDPEYIFDVTNGQEGDKGNGGTEGDAGDAGDPGDPGQTGDGGQGGTAGSPGAPGDQGQNGKPGNPGIDAGDGSGGSGDKPPTLDEEDMLIFPDFVLTLEDIGAYNVQGKMIINEVEGETAVLDDSLTLRIVDAVTGQQVHETSLPAGYDVAMTFQTEALKENTQYIIKVSGAYTFQEENSEREFISKLFTTKALGITLEKKYATANGLCLQAAIEPDCEVKEFTVMLYDENGDLVKESTLVQVADILADATNGVIDFQGLKKNTKYYLKIKAAIEKDAGVNTVYVTPTPDHYLTLKEDPKFGELKVTLSKKDGEFILQPGAVSDPDGGIVSFRYEVYEAKDVVMESGQLVTKGDPVFTTEKANLTEVAVPIDEQRITRATDYRYRVVALFDNNEAKVEKFSVFSEVFRMDGKGYPMAYMTKTSNTATSLDTTVVIDDSEKSMSFWDAGTIKISCVPSNQFENKIVTIYKEYKKGNLPTGSVVNGGKITTPIYINGLKSDENYTILVSASSLVLGDGETVDSPVLTMASIKTMAHEVVQVDKQENSTTLPFDVSLKLSAGSSKNGTESIRGLQGVTLELRPAITGTSTVNGKFGWRNSKWKGKEEYVTDPLATYTFDSSDLKNGVLRLTPDDFSIANNNFQNSVGKNFRITFSEGYDYTRFGSEIKLETRDGKDFVEFKIKKIIPQIPLLPRENTQITLVTNGSAPDSYKDPKIRTNTVVGIKARDKMNNNMCTDVKYYLYKSSITPQAGGAGSIASSDWISIPGGSEDGQLSPEYAFFLKDISQAERGGTYYVMCEYKLDTTSGDGTSLIFPQSNMEGIVASYLTSENQAVPKQKPDLYVYPWSSDNTSSTWRYAVWDPDGALKYETNEASISKVQFTIGRSVEIDSQTPVSGEEGITEIKFSKTEEGYGLDCKALYNLLNGNGSPGGLEFAAAYTFKKDVNWGESSVEYEVDNNKAELVVRSIGTFEQLSRLSTLKVTVSADGVTPEAFQFSSLKQKEDGVIECRIPLSKLVNFAGKANMKLAVGGRYVTGKIGAAYAADPTFYTLNSSYQGSYYFKSDTEGMYFDNEYLGEITCGTSGFKTELSTPADNYTKNNKGSLGLSAKGAEKVLDLSFGQGGVSFVKGGGPIYIGEVGDCQVGEEVPVKDLAYILPQADVSVTRGINKATVTVNISDRVFSKIENNELYLVFDETDGSKFENGVIPSKISIPYQDGQKKYTINLQGLKANQEYFFHIKARMGSGSDLESIFKTSGEDKETPYSFKTINQLTVIEKKIELKAIQYMDKKLTISGKISGLYFQDDYNKIKIEFFATKGTTEQKVGELNGVPETGFTIDIGANPGGDVPLSNINTYPITMVISTIDESPIELGNETIETPKLKTPTGFMILTVGYEADMPSIEAKATIADGTKVIPQSGGGKVGIAFDLYKGRGNSQIFVKREIVEAKLSEIGSGVAKHLFTGLEADTDYTIQALCMADLENAGMSGITKENTSAQGQYQIATSSKRTLAKDDVTVGEMSVSRSGENNLKLSFTNSYKLTEVQFINYTVYTLDGGSVSSGSVTGALAPVVAVDGDYSSTFEQAIVGALPAAKGSYNIVINLVMGGNVISSQSVVLVENSGISSLYARVMETIQTIID